MLLLYHSYVVSLILYRVISYLCKHANDIRCHDADPDLTRFGFGPHWWNPKPYPSRDLNGELQNLSLTLI
jgi:hypothetical protein